MAFGPFRDPSTWTQSTSPGPAYWCRCGDAFALAVDYEIHKRGCVERLRRMTAPMHEAIATAEAEHAVTPMRSTVGAEMANKLGAWLAYRKAHPFCDHDFTEWSRLVDRNNGLGRICRRCGHMEYTDPSMPRVLQPIRYGGA